MPIPRRLLSPMTFCYHKGVSMGYVSNLNPSTKYHFPHILLTVVERTGIWLLELATVLAKGHAIYPSRFYLPSFFVAILMAQLSMKFTNPLFDP